MDIHIEAYRSRIGNYNFSGLYFKVTTSRKRTYKSNTSNIVSIEMFRIIAAVLLTLLIRKNILDKDLHQFRFYSHSSASKSSFNCIQGGQASANCPQTLHLKTSDVLAVPSAAGAKHVHLDRGFIAISSLCRYSAISDRNFYARYTYGNRNSKGIKLCHWNAGSSHLENKNGHEKWNFIDLSRNSDPNERS